MKMTIAEFEAHQIKNGFAPAPTVPEVKGQELLAAIFADGRLDFFLDIIPPTITAQQKGQRVVVPKHGKPFVHHFVKKEVEAAQKQFSRALFPFLPKQPMLGPLRIVEEWRWPWRESEPKRNRAMGWKWKDVAPDFENISKALVDEMGKLGFFKNDGQICDGRVLKKWSDIPGIRITLEKLDQ